MTLLVRSATRLKPSLLKQYAQAGRIVGPTIIQPKSTEITKPHKLLNQIMRNAPEPPMQRRSIREAFFSQQLMSNQQ
jgi:hypothetical protein